MNEDDTKAAQAHDIDQFIMDNSLRWHMNQHPGSRAPNAELCESFGKVGKRVPPEYFALLGPESNFLRDFFLNKLGNPISWSMDAIQEKLLRRQRSSDRRELNGKVLENATKIIECMAAGTFFAGSFVLLYNLRTTKEKFIAAPFLSVGCTIPASFLTIQARGVFMLMAG